VRRPSYLPSGGNPFLLAELLAGLRDERLVRVEGGRAELVQQRLPDRISDSMRTVWHAGASRLVGSPSFGAAGFGRSSRFMAAVSMRGLG
jgi:hypothetical protein